MIAARIVELACLLMCSMIFVSCGSESSSDRAPSPETQSVVKQSPRIRVQAVDIEGAPIAGVMAIATLKANAFDEPLEYGSETKGDGASLLPMPKYFPVHVRAWDPSFRYFANNYFTLEDIPEEDMHLEVTMVPGSALACTVMGAEGIPLVNAEVVLMLVHPERGPWWTAMGQTDGTGRVGFAGIPSGVYDVALRTDSGVAEVKGVTLKPEGQAELGVVDVVGVAAGIS